MAASRSPALKFETVATANCARSSILTLPHDVCLTPMFMPVGTYGAMKGITPEQMYSVDCHLILGNTYHLGQRPGTKLLAEMGGLHKFMNWKRNMLTDSGGFQMVSLLHLAEITEEGVTFQSPSDGSLMLLTPEKSIEMQNEIGADIMMALDDVVHTLTTGKRVEEAMERSIRWLDRCISAHSRPTEQNLFGIIQGGLDLDLRRHCLEAMVTRDLPGYAIGGLSGGEDKNQFWRVVKECCDYLPKDKPRYLMGVGYPVDLVVCTALGVDMFDCVYPCRTARFGVALTAHGNMQLKKAEYKSDLRPIEDNCICVACQKHTRSFLHSVATKESVGAQLISLHNIAYLMRLMKGIRAAIETSVEAHQKFVVDFMAAQHPDGKYPGWAVDALASVDIHLPSSPLPASE